jgi:hypothetical protein
MSTVLPMPEKEQQEETAIRRLAERGLRLFPVVAGDKVPLTAQWPKRATCDLKVLEAWRLQFPGCNWGLACGPDSRVFVVDVDGDDGAASLHELIENYGHEWTNTLNAKTARGSHFYFRYPADAVIRNSTSKLAPGIDVRGEGGYVLVPPSVHPSGASYCWSGAGKDAQILTAPVWLLKKLTAPAERVSLTPEIGGDTIPEGQRNTTLTKFAGAMQRPGMTLQAIEAALLAENAARCRPALTEAEVREIARSVARYAPASKPQNSELETAALLDDLRHFILRFLVISDAQAVALCVFVLYTYAAEQFDCAPYLWITSAEKRSGKSRLLEVLELLVNCPWLTSRTSAAALVRKLNKDHPTLLLDESDAAFSGDKEYSEVLRSVLNAGHRKGGKVSLCLGKGSKLQVIDFYVFGPKVIAGIGRLPDTVTDRSIPIQIQRKRPGENVERFRARLIDPDARDLRERLAQWATEDRLAMLRCAWPDLPEAFSDRQQDVSEPLLAVADLAGSEWGKVGRRSLTELFGGTAAADDSLSVRLLSDIRVAFEGHDRLGSKELVGALVEMEGAPWAELNHGREITTNTIARLLRKFEIAPRTIRGDAGTFKGYLRDFFEDAWARYLGPNSSTSASPAVTPSQAAKTLNEAQFPETSRPPSATVQESEAEAVFKGLVTPVTVQAPIQATHAEHAEKVVLTGEL